MSSIFDKQIEEWRRLANAATPGPWTFVSAPENYCQGIVRDGEGDQVCDAYDNTTWSGDQSRANAQFIAASRTVVVALLDELANTRRAIVRFRAWCLDPNRHPEPKRTPSETIEALDAYLVDEGVVPP